jgi:hypothetical protein
MDGYRIRRGGVEKRVADDTALATLAAAGGVRGTDEIETAAGWIRASQHPIVRGALRAGDPWAAWSDVESVDAASLYKKMVDTPDLSEEVELVEVVEVPELPVDALAPVPEPPALGPPLVAPADAPPRGPRSLTDAPRAPRTPPVPGVLLAPLPEDGAEVIDFPRARPARPAVALPTPTRRPSGPPPLVRTSRVLAMVLGGLTIVMMGYLWIRMSAYTGLGEGTIPSRATAEKAALAPISPLIPLDVELRAALPTHPRDVKEAGDLSDALLVELVQQRLEIIEADGVVTKWIGRKGDEPKSAEVRISYRSGGDLTRELGAIALVVGRYKRFYRLDIPVFEVTEVGARGVTRIRAEDAEAYYQARMSLEDLLKTLTKR